MEDFIAQLELFSEKVITLGKSISSEEIEFFERRTRLILPADYKKLLKSLMELA